MKSCHAAGPSLSADRIKRRSNIRIPLLPLHFILSETSCDYGSLVKQRPAQRRAPGTERELRQAPENSPECSLSTGKIPLQPHAPSRRVCEGCPCWNKRVKGEECEGGSARSPFGFSPQLASDFLFCFAGFLFWLGFFVLFGFGFFFKSDSRRSLVLGVNADEPRSL